jgi:hypothetical protein
MCLHDGRHSHQGHWCNYGGETAGKETQPPGGGGRGLGLGVKVEGARCEELNSTVRPIAAGMQPI